MDEGEFGTTGLSSDLGLESPICEDDPQQIIYTVPGVVEREL